MEAPIGMNAPIPSFFSREEFWLAAAAVAVGLVVAWILRGAPPGQASATEDDEQEIGRAHV